MTKWDVSHMHDWKWKDLPTGAIIPTGGNAVEYKTGGWRSMRPDLIPEKCTNCMICWILCPDSSIRVEDERMVGFDFDHCKGCGICAAECPTKAIAMIEEAAAEGEAG